MPRRPDNPPRPVGPPPDRASLRAAAEAHIARFAATERGLAQVLERRITRWGRRAAEDGQDSTTVTETVNRIRPLAGEIAHEMVELGAVNDQAFAKSRAARLTRSGRSRRAVQAQLAAKGIAPDEATQAMEEALGDDDAARDAELAAALIFARKRRAGPFRRDTESADMPPEDEIRIYSAFARAGFSHTVAEKALSMDPEEAETRIFTLKANL
ncbi:regulatory protein RecX [Acetobacter sp. LMG 1627]|uniref:Regulatory protein RecX n=2 Tax=Acetobacter conturbans TaxID=1737472 RepID=A0ABX0K0F0_9PROT|nr:regulatory protein RecX [Acetobacter conturbans]